MPYIGKTPTAAPLSASDLDDDIISLAKMASGTDGNLITYDASGNPVAVATGDDGQILTSAGAGQPCAFEAAAGGGLTAASQWRITSDFSDSAEPIASNWEETDAPTGFGVLGSSMTESSGIFTFPSTGYWYINAFAKVRCTGVRVTELYIYTTHDDSTYAKATHAALVTDDERDDMIRTDYIFDVTSTSTHKMRLDHVVDYASIVTRGDTDFQQTGITFMRLADT